MADAWVAILMGSTSDMDTMKTAAAQLEEFGVKSEIAVRSAHRQPQALHEFMADAEARGVGAYICGAGMSAALPGVVASGTVKPVIGVPLSSGAVGGLDALLSVAQMPKGVPVACVAVDGARNAALLAVQILAVADKGLESKFADFKARQAEVT